jgi:phospholipase/lecithinase/hemolysin
MAASGAAQATAATNLARHYDQQLASQLTALAVADKFSLDIVDFFSDSEALHANPAAFGLTNVTTPVWSGNTTDPLSGTLQAATLAAQDKFLFWDALHPTEAVHQLLATAAGAILFG